MARLNGTEPEIIYETSWRNDKVYCFHYFADRRRPPLKNLPQLREITLSNTQVTGISPLAEIPALEMIWLYGAPVVDVSCLAQLPKLNDLNLLKTEVTI